jgi:hypothetical protein
MIHHPNYLTSLTIKLIFLLWWSDLGKRNRRSGNIIANQRISLNDEFTRKHPFSGNIKTIKINSSIKD